MEDFVNMSLMAETANNGESGKTLLLVEFSILALLLLLSFMVNLSLLLVFARKESLRTTSNTLIINLLLVNVTSLLLLLPLVALDSLPMSMASLQCELSQAVSQVVAALSLLSTLLVAYDQYLAVLRPLRYHHHMTRAISSALISSVWTISLLSCLPSLFLTVPSPLWQVCNHSSPSLAPLLASFAITFLTVLLPSVLLAVIYCHIFSEAHISSARNRKNSLAPASSDSIYCIASTAAGPLGVSQADLLGASRMRAVSMETVPSRSTSVSVCQVRVATSHLHWEEGRAAMVCLASMAALLLCWAPLYITSTVHTASLLLSSPLPLPAWIPFLLHLLSLLYSLVSPFLFAYRHRKIRQEVRRLWGFRPPPSAPPPPLHQRPLPRSLLLLHSKHQRSSLESNTTFSSSTDSEVNDSRSSSFSNESPSTILTNNSSSAEECTATTAATYSV